MSNDLISRSALLEQIKSQMPQFGGGIISQTIDVCTDVAVELVKEAPAVDAVPVVHGRWELPDFIREDDEDAWLDPRVKCSVCGLVEVAYARWVFCPNCGAKMDGGNDG